MRNLQFGIRTRIPNSEFRIPNSQTAAPSGYCSASRNSLASESTVVPVRFHCPSVSNRRSIGVLLIQAPDDVGRDANERSERRRAPDAVFAAVPRAAEDERNLLEVVDEELLRLLVHVGRAPSAEHTALSKQLLQFLREGRLRHPAAADAQEFDLVVQR